MEIALVEQDGFSLPIYGFLHVATHGKWKQVLAELIDSIKTSGLYSRMAGLFIGIVGPDSSDYSINDEKITVAYVSDCIEDFEFPTIELLHQFSKDYDCLVFYIHTKGVFTDSAPTDDWRKYMAYFSINRHLECLEALKRYDICGVNWQTRPWPHFSGNFWWARSSYLRQLKPVRSLSPLRGGHQPRTPRHQCERWIGTGETFRAASLHQSHINHYSHPYPREMYDGGSVDALRTYTSHRFDRQPRIAIIYDNITRPDTTGFYCLRALSKITKVAHFQPYEMKVIPLSSFDLFLFIDDGLDYEIPPHLKPSVLWAVDTHLSPQRIISRAKTADFTVSAQQDGVDLLLKHGVNCIGWLPLACDPGIHEHFDSKKEYDVCFIANMVNQNRKDLAELITQRYPNSFVGQRFFSEMAHTYSASRIVINSSVRNDINMRVFEALACGSLLITNDLAESGQAKLFTTGEHLVTYRNLDDLMQKIDYYLENEDERERIAAAGRTIALEKNTYDHRLRALLASIETKLSVPSAISPSEPPIAHIAQFGVTSIIIPVCGQLSITQQCIESIRRNTKTPFELIVIDNASADGTLEYLESCSDIRVLKNCTNRGYAAAINQGITACGSDHFVLLNNDTIVADGWLERMLAVMCNDPSVGLVGPCTNRAPGAQCIPNSCDDVSNLDEYAREYCEAEFGRREIATVLVGFCMLVSRRVVKSIGLLDESFGIGTYEDYDFCRRATAAGFRLAIARDSYVHHIGSTTFSGLGINLPQLLEHNEKKFRDKVRCSEAAQSGTCLPDTTIIIITCNCLDYTKQCLNSLQACSAEPVELIVVDNGSTDGTQEFIKSQSSLRLIVNETNRGFPAAVNQAIRVSNGKYIVLLNNDVIVTSAWLGRLRFAIDTAADIGIAGPCANNVSGLQSVDAGYASIGQLEEFSSKWAKRYRGVIQQAPRLVGFCMMIKREVLDAIGEFDEQFGIGNFEDDDFCRRAALAGFRLIVAKECYVHHYGSATFRSTGINYKALLEENQKLYSLKWANMQDPRSMALCPQVRRLRPGITLCMIVRDSLRTLRACLESIRPWVDQMVVVDTGSVDDTPTVAAELGADLYHFQWCDDFAAARNQSLLHAECEWIFWMDSDDTISAENGKKLRELADRRHPPSTMGFVVQVHCPPSDVDDCYSTATSVDHVKLIRNHRDIRFSGRIHEQVLSSIRSLGGQVEWTDIFVSHSGSDLSSDGRARKLMRDLRLLHQEMKDNPDNSFTLFNLGMTLLDSGSADEALAPLCQSLQLANPNDSHVRKLYAMLAQAYSALGRRETSLKTCRQGLQLFPSDPELRFRYGVLLHSFGHLPEAEKAFLAVLDHPVDRHFSSVDTGILGVKAWHNLAIVYQAQQKYQLAAESWRRVIGHQAGGRDAWRGLIDSLARARAIEELSRIGNDNGDQHVPEDLAKIAKSKACSLSGNGSEAISILVAAFHLFDSEECLRELCEVAFGLEELTTAEEFLRILADRSPNDGAVHQNLAMVLLKRRNYAEAVKWAESSLRLRPGYTLAQQILNHATASLPSNAPDRGVAFQNISISSRDRPIYGFMHIAMMNHWRRVVDDQIIKLKASGLWEKCERIFVSALGGRREDLKFEDPKISIVYHSENLKEFEQPTLAHLQDFCRCSEKCWVFYIHTKGVGRLAPGQEQWRHSMEHFTIIRHADCINALAANDVCGINWHVADGGWCRIFGGNFWWARSEYIASLPDVSKIEAIGGEDTVRLACERWIGSNPTVRAACLFDSRTDHYADVPFPRSRYASLKEVNADGTPFRPASAWRGLENRFQDLLEPITPIQTVVEIGVMHGFSLFCLASALPNATIYGIDPYHRISEERRAKLAVYQNPGNIGASEAEEWVLQHLAHFPNARLIGDSGENAIDLITSTIDVLHLDAVPTYDETAAEFNRWLPKLKPGGCVLFHDTVTFRDQVGRFFHELPGRKVEISDCHGLGAWYKLI